MLVTVKISRDWLYSGSGFHALDLRTVSKKCKEAFAGSIEKVETEGNVLTFTLPDTFSKSLAGSRLDSILAEVCGKDNANKVCEYFLGNAPTDDTATEELTSVEESLLALLKDGGEASGGESVEELVIGEASGSREASTELQNEEAAADESLSKLIGLASVKTEISSMVSLLLIQREHGMRDTKTVSAFRHLVFTGNPGTGKSTVARILAQKYKEMGLISKGQLVATSWAELMRENGARVTVKIREKIAEACGGVLFIDEAYSISDMGSADSRREAIDALIKGLDEHCDELAVVLAGCAEPMNSFIDSYSELQARFNKTVDFSDYSAEELTQIIFLMFKTYDYAVADKAKGLIERGVAELAKTKNGASANACGVRCYFEKILQKQARRVVSTQCDSLTLITEADVPLAV